MLYWVIGGIGVILLLVGVFTFFTVRNFVLPSIGIMLIGLIFLGIAWYLMK
jgi:hypothetical protein